MFACLKHAIVNNAPSALSQSVLSMEPQQNQWFRRKQMRNGGVPLIQEEILDTNLRDKATKTRTAAEQTGRLTFLGTLDSQRDYPEGVSLMSFRENK